MNQRDLVDDDPPGLDQEAWERWLDYRKQIRKTLKPVSWPAAKRKLARFGADQAEVVEQSIANGWQGLFALKDKPNGTAKSQPSTRYRDATEKLREWAESGDP